MRNSVDNTALDDVYTPAEETEQGEQEIEQEPAEPKKQAKGKQQATDGPEGNSGG